MPRSALLIVDVQNDFITGSLALSTCPGGQDGGEVVPAINQLLRKHSFDVLVYTLDSHPAGHVSFSQWPVHCIAGSWGERLHADLVVAQESDTSQVLTIKKGTNPAVDSYSAFWDNDHGSESTLRGSLEDAAIETVFLVGLALDVCVYFTALDAAKAGFRTFIITDCCRSVNGEESAEMLEKKRKLGEAGVRLINSQQLPQYLL